jgi:hypothetical protein
MVGYGRSRVEAANHEIYGLFLLQFNW